MERKTVEPNNARVIGSWTDQLGAAGGSWSLRIMIGRCLRGIRSAIRQKRHSRERVSTDELPQNTAD